jgi:fibronectin-binding autotransporter adhesin
MRFTGLRFAAIGAIASIVLTFATTANAGTKYYWWGSDAILGGAGTWDTASTYWSNVSTSKSGVAWPNTTDCDAYFGGTASGVITVGGSITAGSVAIATSGYTFSGGTLGLAYGIGTTYGSSGTTAVNSAVRLLANQTWSVGTGGGLTVIGAISGSGGITKTGAGTLTIAGTNSFTGGVTLSAGYLLCGYVTGSSASNAFGSGTLTLSGGTLASNFVTSSQPANYITCPVYVTPGIASNFWVLSGLYFTGKFTGSGTINIMNGTQSIYPNGDLSEFAGTIRHTNSCNLWFSGGNNVGSDLATFILYGTSGSRGLTWATGSNVSASGTVNMGELSGTGGRMGGYYSLNTVTFKVGALNTNSTFSGIIANNYNSASTTSFAALFKVGTGMLTLDGTNGYTGNTTISAGTLCIGSGAAGGSIVSNVIDNSVLAFKRSGAYEFGGNISGAGSVAHLGSGTLTLTGTNACATNVYAGTLQIGSGITTGAVTNNIYTAIAATLAFNRSNAYSYDYAISGSGSVAQLGAGVLTLSQTNSYTGTTTVAAGTLRVTGSIATSSSVSVSAGASLTGSGTATSVGVASGGIIGSSIDNSVWGGTWSFGSLSLAGDSYFNFGNISAYTTTAAVTVTGTDSFASAGTINVGLYGISPVGAGTAHLVQYSGTPLSLSYKLGTVSFATFRSGCTLTTSTIGAVNYLDANYYVDYPCWTGAGDGIWTTIPATVTNWKLVTAGTQTDYVNDDAVMFDDTVNSGGATPLAATVTLGENVAPHSVTFNNSSTVSYTIVGGVGNYVIGGSTSLTLNGAGTVTLLTGNTYNGATAINAGALILGDGGSIAGNVVNGSVFAFNHSDNYTFGYAVSGSGSVAQVGSGTLTLSGASTYSGATTVNAGGVVNIQSNTALGVGGTVTVAAGAALQVQGGLTVANAMSLTGTGIANDGALRNLSGANMLGGPIALAGNTQISVDAGTLSLTGQVSGGYALTKTGAGTLTVSAANTYSGGTTLSAGMILLNASSTTTVLGSGTITMAGGILATGTASAPTLSNAISIADGATAYFQPGYNIVWNGNITGGTDTTFSYSNPIRRCSLNMFGDNSGFKGTFNVDAANGNFYLGTTDAGSEDAKFFLTNSGTRTTDGIYYGGTASGTIKMGELASDSSNVRVRNSVGSTNLTYEIGHLGTSSTYAGVIINTAGTVSLTKVGAGTLTLTGSNTYTGLTTISDGTLQLGSGGTASYIQSDVVNNASLVYNRSDNFTPAYSISGTGSVTKLGSGRMTLSSTYSYTYTGTTTVGDGTLLVNGSLASPVDVIAGVLGGSGTIAASVTVGAAELAPGSSPATLTISSAALGLSSSSTLSYELCGTDTTVGGGINDLIQSVTDLVLDGTLNVTETVSNSFLSANAGDQWTLITYTNNLTDNGLELGTMPALSGGMYFAVDTATAGQVNLVVVPEPGTLALLAAGLIGLIAYAWRRRK